MNIDRVTSLRSITLEQCRAWLHNNIAFEHWGAEENESLATFVQGKMDEVDNIVRKGVTKVIQMEVEKYILATKRGKDSEWTTKMQDIIAGAVIKTQRECLEKVEDWLQHDMRCILAQCSAGEPTADGGYRLKFAGKWYPTKPIDETPKCTCGLDDIRAELLGIPEGD